jgi:hypothetical protein
MGCTDLRTEKRAFQIYIANRKSSTVFQSQVNRTTDSALGRISSIAESRLHGGFPSFCITYRRNMRTLLQQGSPHTYKLISTYYIITWQSTPHNIVIFWDIAPCNPYVNRHFGGTYHFHLQGRKSDENGTSVQQVSSHMLEYYYQLCSSGCSQIYTVQQDAAIYYVLLSTV